MNELIKDLIDEAQVSDGRDGIGGSRFETDEELLVQLVIKHCATEAAMFSINKNQLHPDVPYDQMPESAKTVNHMTCQLLSRHLLEAFDLLPKD